MEWLPDAQAVAVARLGPCKLYFMDTQPAAILIMAEGVKKGDIRRGPLLKRVAQFCSMLVKPPMPAPIATP